MTTTIKSRESGTTIELELVNDSGMDFLADVMGGCGIERGADADFVVAKDYELDWWETWTATEPLIWAARDDADDETRAKDDKLIDAYGHDMELLQDRECELFGIER